MKENTNNMKRLKIVKRDGLPETNSSSSHSVVVSDKEFSLQDISSELIPEDNGKIMIHGHSFNWEWEKYNDVITKTQYAIAASIYDDEKIERIKRVFKEFSGYELEIEDENDSDKLRSIFSVDHNSSDIFDDFLQTDETLKNFIFNPQSWLFLGNDNSEPPVGFYKVHNINNYKNPAAIASIDFGDEIGRIDFELFSYPGGILQELEDEDNQNLLASLCISNGKVTSLRLVKEAEMYFFRSTCCIERDGKYYVRFMTKETRQLHSDVLRASDWNFDQGEKFILSREYGKDYVEFPIEIYDNEFGKLD